MSSNESLEENCPWGNKPSRNIPPNSRPPSEAEYPSWGVVFVVLQSNDRIECSASGRNSCECNVSTLLVLRVRAMALRQFHCTSEIVHHLRIIGGWCKASSYLLLVKEVTQFCTHEVSSPI